MVVMVLMVLVVLGVVVVLVVVVLLLLLLLLAGGLVRRQLRGRPVKQQPRAGQGRPLLLIRRYWAAQTRLSR